MSCQCGQNDHSHSAGQCCGGCGHREIVLSDPEKSFLMKFKQIPFLPVARFIMSSSKSSHLQSVGLAPVYLTDGKETVEQIKEKGAVLVSLQEKGLIALDYDQPLQGYDYKIYSQAEAYRLFKDTVIEGSQKHGFLFDTPQMDLGSMALTSLGQRTVIPLELSE